MKSPRIAGGIIILPQQYFEKDLLFVLFNNRITMLADVIPYM